MIKLKAVVTFEYETDEEWYREGATINDVVDGDEIDLLDSWTLARLITESRSGAHDVEITPLKWPKEMDSKED